MPVTIGQLTTEVIADRGAASSAAPTAGASPQAQQAAIRVQLATVVRDESRTQAEGFDD